MNRSFLTMLLIVASLPVLRQASAAAPRPNVLFIAIDDQNDWIGHLGGHPLAKTPHIDALAGRGTAFLNAHIQSPLCNPCRTSLMLGLRPTTTGIYGLAPWFRNVPAWKDRVALPQHFAAHGYRMGVISDTFPSLRLTLEAVGLDQYFEVFVCSDQVGVMKPEPLIYQTALSRMGVSAQESLYVDDYDVEADGARALGFTAFHICRDSEPKECWDIASLQDMVEFLT